MASILRSRASAVQSTHAEPSIAPALSSPPSPRDPALALGEALDTDWYDLLTAYIAGMVFPRYSRVK
jgi:hypothetical protein